LEGSGQYRSDVDGELQDVVEELPPRTKKQAAAPEPGDFYEFDIKAHPVRGPHTARFRVSKTYVTPEGTVIPLVEDFTNERGGGLYPIFPTQEGQYGARLVKGQEGMEPGFFPLGHEQKESTIEKRSSEPARAKPAKSLIRTVIDMGGLSAEKVKKAGFNVKEDFQQHGLSFIFRKNGRSLDDIATELVSSGVIPPGPDTIPSDNYVLSLLQAAARGQKVTVDQLKGELNTIIREQADDILELKEDLKRHGADESQIEDAVRAYQDAAREDTRPQEADRDAGEARARGDETLDDAFVAEEEPTEVTSSELRPPLRPEPVEEVSASPVRPTEGWENEPGSMPGEPILTHRDGAIIERIGDDDMVLYEAVDNEGKSLGIFPELDDARRAVEEGTALTPAEDAKRAQAPQGGETGGELFDTSGMFSLSGNQPVEQKTMKVAGKKGERMFDVEKQDVDELMDRLSGEKAKREYEEGTKESVLDQAHRSFVASQMVGGEARKARARPS
jgi:hypothetical protein